MTSSAPRRCGSRTPSRRERPSPGPILAESIVEALNADGLPAVRSRGSIGLSDLAPLAELALGILGDLELAQGEAIALLNQGAFSTGWGALAVHDAITLLDTLDVAGALDLEALGANRSALDPAIATVRPYPGIRATLERLDALLAGGSATPRALQDPLSFRTLPQVHGAARDAFGSSSPSSRSSSTLRSRTRWSSSTRASSSPSATSSRCRSRPRSTSRGSHLRRC